MKQSKFWTAVEYLSVFFLLLESGSLLQVIYGHYITATFFLFVVLLAYKFRPSYDYSFIFVIGLTTLILVSSLYNTPKTPRFLFYILLAFFSYLLCRSFSFHRFKHVFLNVVTLLGISSLLVFFVVNNFSVPLSHFVGNTVTIEYYMFHSVGWNGYLFSRIAGLYTEPGAYQFCLSYALLIHVEDFVNQKMNLFDKVKLLIVTIVDLLCASTTGYIILLIIMVYVIIKYQSKYRLFLFPILVVVGFYFAKELISSDSIAGKFSQTNDNSSYMMRMSDTRALASMIVEEPLLGNGIESQMYSLKSRRYGNNTSSNGVLCSMAMIGVGWLILYVIFCRKTSKTYFKKTPWSFIVFMSLLVQTNENFSFLPIAYLFVFNYKDNCKKLDCYLESKKLV